jgi:RNA polymerase sigma-70 factor (ECF subfamily)
VEADPREEQRFRREQADFESLFRTHYAEIVRYLTGRLGSRERADDLAAEVFLEAYRRVPLLRWRGRPVLAWLYRVAANMAADDLKRARGEVPLGDAEPASSTPDAAESIAEREALTRALRKLPPDYQLVVHLRLVEGYPFADVSRMTGRSIGACQMQLLRAGRLLRAALHEEGIRAPA